jgi:hypothetical protein
MKPTREQMKSFLNVYNRDRSIAPSYLQFRRTIKLAFSDCYMIPWKGMFLGVETDGYIHS